MTERQKLVMAGLNQRLRLRKLHGGARWRKLEGVATVEFPDGSTARAEVHWYEVHGIGRRRDEDQADPWVTTVAKAHRYGVCVDNRGNPATLEVRKIYRLLDNAAAESEGLVRVIGESLPLPGAVFPPDRGAARSGESVLEEVRLTSRCSRLASPAVDRQDVSPT